MGNVIVERLTVHLKVFGVELVDIAQQLSLMAPRGLTMVKMLIVTALKNGSSCYCRQLSRIQW
jgi:hypothetical protein